MVLMFQIDFESIALAGVNDLIQVYGFDGVDGVDVFMIVVLLTLHYLNLKRRDLFRFISLANYRWCRCFRIDFKSIVSAGIDHRTINKLHFDFEGFRLPCHI